VIRMAKVIQVTLTDEEYVELEQKALAEGNTINQYLKNLAFPNNDFKRWFPDLLRRVDAMSGGTEFNIRAVMAVDWLVIPRGIRLALGRVFFQHVDAGKIENVTATEPDSSRVQWYIKE